ncbi:hypothetical protein SAMN03159341_12459 [Paenibacillus sp. 1_12]|nr:hypothetical protein SAMN03159341_12459 [Paenibacillus sp. 1_12]
MLLVVKPIHAVECFAGSEALSGSIPLRPTILKTPKLLDNKGVLFFYFEG